MDGRDVAKTQIQCRSVTNENNPIDVTWHLFFELKVIRIFPGSRRALVAFQPPIGDLGSPEQAKRETSARPEKGIERPGQSARAEYDSVHPIE